MDVPAHFQHETHVQTGVTVKGGTNYDLSRTAAVTPLTRILVVEPPPQVPAPTPRLLEFTEYTAEDRMPAGSPVVTIDFAKNSHVLASPPVPPKQARKLKGKKVVVAGHSDAEETNPAELSLKRAQAVGTALKKYGAKPEVRSFGVERELTNVPEYRPVNRRVEVFEIGEKPKK